MATLPIASSPKYKLTIPSTGKKVSFRPFLVKEQKALLIAQNSEDPDVMITTLIDVIESCISEEINATTLALFDIEYIFTQLRAKSVGEEVELILKCDTCVSDKATVSYLIDLTKLQVTTQEGHDKKIPLFDDVGVIMKYPSLNLLSKIEQMNNGDVELLFDIICESIELVYNTDEVFYTKDQTKEEVQQFVGNLTQEQFKKLQNFFETMPKLEQNVKFKCPVCSKEHDKMIKGIEAFF